MTSGLLTTVVRRKTGRPVQEWITERRMAQARRLLAETDLTVTEVGRRVVEPRGQAVYSAFSVGSPARRQATKPPATSAAPLRSVAFERTACWQR